MVGRSSAESSAVENVDVDELPAGTALMNGAYTIENFLNAGGFGMTYIARDSLNRRVVIKECFPGAFCRRKDNAVQPRSRGHQEELKSVVTLFVNEAKALAKLDHPGIVAVHQVFEENNTAYMALDFVQGRDLLDILIDEDISLNEQDIEVILRKLLEAVGFIHEAGLLHRDISPDNILIDDDLNPVLIDFGAAREQATKKTRVMSALRVVKDGYSPQEFYIGGSEQGAFSDLYSLGACFYHLLTNDIPPDGQVRIAALASGDEDPYRPLVDRVEGFREDFLKAIDKSLAVLPKDRVRSAAQWLQMLDGEKIGPQRVTQLEIKRADGEDAATGEAAPNGPDAKAEPMAVRRATRPLSKFAPPMTMPTQAPAAPEVSPEAIPVPEAKSTPVLGKILASVAAIGIVGAGVASQTDLLKAFDFSGAVTQSDATESAAATPVVQAEDAASAEAAGGPTAGAVVSDTPAWMNLPATEEIAPANETELAAIADAIAAAEVAAATPADAAVADGDPASDGAVATDTALAGDKDPLTVAPVLDGPIMTRWSVALPDGMSFDADGGESRIRAVNGVPVETRAEFDAVLMNSIDPGTDPSIEVQIARGASASESTEDTVDLAVVHSIEVAGGLRFETTHDGTIWKTNVASMPETSTLELAADDQILAFLTTSEMVDGVDTLPAILERELAAEAGTLVFAVQRDGENWAVSIPAESLFAGTGG